MKRKQIFSFLGVIILITSFICFPVSAANSTSEIEDDRFADAFRSFAQSAFVDDGIQVENLTLSEQGKPINGIDGKEYWCFTVEYEEEYFGYAILGAPQNSSDIKLIEFSHEESPFDVACNEYDINDPQIIYAGPFSTFIADNDINSRSLNGTEAINLETGEKQLIPQFDTFGEWYEPEADIMPYGEPPQTASKYKKISFYNDPIFDINIQYSLRPILSYLYSCGPAAGTYLLYTLGDRNSSYNDMLWWPTDPNRPVDVYEMAELLVNYMSALAGTTFDEFTDGIYEYMKSYGHSPSIKAELRSDKKSFGTPTTTSNTVVWNNLKAGINGNKPVAVFAGNKTSNGSSLYPDTGDTSAMEFHWFTALGYIEDLTSNNTGLYLYASSWGEEKYVSYSALCYWRNGLGSVYVNANYN